MHAYIPPGQAEEKQPEEEKGALKLFLSLPDIPDSYQGEMATLTSKKEETGADQTDALSPLQAPTPLFKHAHMLCTLEYMHASTHPYKHVLEPLQALLLIFKKDLPNEPQPVRLATGHFWWVHAASRS